ncbi:MAG TPA: response regulator [Pseudoalteromonas sp.]|nr:response regulator [Pseudoalteromonas sp.]|tara:strand:- start:1603 stop:2856 length:1254 start_codon:yes stop_codon:yes gene_type:complete
MDPNLDSPIVLFISDKESDQIIYKLLTQKFTAPQLSYNTRDITKALLTSSPKVFLMTGDTLESALEPYYQAVDVVKDLATCEHKVACLIPRHFETDAYEAHSAGIIDDYMVARPVYELHRILLICEHLLIELGVSTQLNNKSTPDNIVQSFNEGLRTSVQRVLAVKYRIQKKFEKTLAEIEASIDDAVTKYESSQVVNIDLNAIKSTLASIKSDQIRPQLINLQSKVLKLLEETLPDKTTEQKDSEHKTSDEGSEPPKTPKTYQFNRLYKSEVDPETLLKETKSQTSVLIVEDDIISLQLTRKLLSRYPYKSSTAQTGREAYASLTHNHFDLVLMDINLPDSNGIYIIDKILSGNGPNKNTPFIILSGNKQKSIVEQAVQRGAKGYVVKPLHKSTLDKIIAKYLSSDGKVEAQTHSE